MERKLFKNIKSTKYIFTVLCMFIPSWTENQVNVTHY